MAAKLTAAQMIALDGPISVKAPLDGGWSVPLAIPTTGPTLDTEELVSAVLSTPQKADKSGLLTVKGPSVPITAEGRLTGREASQSAKRTPTQVARYLYLAAGMDPEDYEETATPPAKADVPPPVAQRMGPQKAGEPVNGDKAKAGK